VPAAPAGIQWRIAVDTGRDTPQELFPAGEEPAFDSAKPYPMTPRSSAIMLWRKDGISHENKQMPTYAVEQSGSAILVRSNSPEVAS
jgi:hypothetical protein